MSPKDFAQPRVLELWDSFFLVHSAEIPWFGAKTKEENKERRGLNRLDRHG